MSLTVGAYWLNTSVMLGLHYIPNVDLNYRESPICTLNIARFLTSEVRSTVPVIYSGQLKDADIDVTLYLHGAHNDGNGQNYKT